MHESKINFLKYVTYCCSHNVNKMTIERCNLSKDAPQMMSRDYAQEVKETCPIDVKTNQVRLYTNALSSKGSA